MEFGQRALGNRSILADPRRADMKDKVNSAVKFRESFRPFAPAVLIFMGAIALGESRRMNIYEAGIDDHVFKYKMNYASCLLEHVPEDTIEQYGAFCTNVPYYTSPIDFWSSAKL